MTMHPWLMWLILDWTLDFICTTEFRAFSGKRIKDKPTGLRNDPLNSRSCNYSRMTLQSCIWKVQDAMPWGDRPLSASSFVQDGGSVLGRAEVYGQLSPGALDVGKAAHIPRLVPGCLPCLLRPPPSVWDPPPARAPTYPLLGIMNAVLWSLIQFRFVNEGITPTWVLKLCWRGFLGIVIS